MKLKNVLYLVLFLSTNSGCFGQDAIEIINRYIDSTGGIENWKNVQTVYKESYVIFENNYLGYTSESIVDNKTPSLHLTYKKMDTKQQKTEVYKNFQLEGRIYCHGENCDMFIRRSKVPVRLNSDLALLKFTAITFAEWLNKKKNIFFKYIGAEEMKGNNYYIVQITNPKAKWKQRQNCYFNTKTFLIDYLVDIDNKDNFTKLDDYRKVGNVIVPFKTYSKKGGVEFFRSEIRKMEFNIDLEDNIFDL